MHSKRSLLFLAYFTESVIKAFFEEAPMRGMISPSTPPPSSSKLDSPGQSPQSAPTAHPAPIQGGVAESPQALNGYVISPNYQSFLDTGYL